MGASPRSPYSLSRLAALSFLALALPLVAWAQGADDPGWQDAFDQAWKAAEGKQSFAPSALSRRIALAAGAASWRGLDAAEAASLAYDLALEAERALRFGSSAQEARAMAAQRIALTARSPLGSGEFLKELRSSLRDERAGKGGRSERPPSGSSAQRGGGGHGATGGGKP